MIKKKYVLKRLRWALLRALLIGTIGAILVMFEDFTALARFSFDVASTLRPPQHIDDIAIVYVDYTSLNALGVESDGILGRRHLAGLIARCAQAQAKLVFLDHTFDHAQTNDDAEFTKTVRASNVPIVYGSLPAPPDAGKLAPKLFDERAIAVRTNGTLEIFDYPGNKSVRQLTTVADNVPAAAWLVAGILKAPVATENINATRWLRYYGRPGEVFTNKSLLAALDPKQTQSDFFRERVVCVGAGANLTRKNGDTCDQFNTPWSRFGEGRVAGVDIHATSISNLLRGDWLKRPRTAIEMTFVFLFGFGVTLLVAGLWPNHHWGGAIILLLVTLGVSLALLLIGRIWWDWPVAIFCQILPATFLIAHSSRLELGLPLVFISYRTSDGAPYALNMQFGLRDKLTNAWLDKDDLKIGARISATIKVAIAEIPNYLLVLTPEVIEKVRDPERPNVLLEELESAGLTCPLTDESIINSGQKRPKIIIVLAKSSDKKQTQEKKKAPEEKQSQTQNPPLLLELIAALKESNPARKPINGLEDIKCASYDDDMFDGTILKIGEVLVGKNARQRKAFRLSKED